MLSPVEASGQGPYARTSTGLSMTALFKLLFIMISKLHKL